MKLVVLSPQAAKTEILLPECQRCTEKKQLETFWQVCFPIFPEKWRHSAAWGNKNTLRGMKVYWYVTNKATIELKSQNWKTKNFYQGQVDNWWKCAAADISVSSIFLLLLLQPRAQSQVLNSQPGSKLAREDREVSDSLVHTSKAKGQGLLARGKQRLRLNLSASLKRSNYIHSQKHLTKAGHLVILSKRQKLMTQIFK